MISGSSAFSKTSYFGNYYINFLLVLSIFVYKMFAFLLSVSIWGIIMCSRASLVAQRLKHLPPMRETWVRSLGREDPRRRKWQPTPVFMPGESHGRRSLARILQWVAIPSPGDLPDPGI